MAGELPDDIKATLSILDSQTPPPPAKLKTTRTMEDIALPTKRQPAGGDDVLQTLAILDGKEPEPVATAGEPDPRDIEVDVLKLALRKGINSNTALAAHRQSVARKLNISPALVTPQAEESAFYQDHDPEDLHKNYPALAKYLKVEGNAELVGKNIEPMKELEVFFRRSVQDPEIMVAKGVVGAASAIVGLGNLVSAGKAGKYVEEHGIDLKKIQGVLNDLYTPETQKALEQVSRAEGFFGTIEAALKNPSSIGVFTVESLPQMYLGRIFGSGLKAVFPGLPFGAAGAAGEGITMAGGSAEQIRSATEDGELTAGQAALSVGVGVVGTALSAFGAKLATKLGIEDVDAALVAGKLLSRLEDAGVPKQLAVRLVGGAAVEGAVEEMPQSVVEQIAQNVALGRAWDEGVPESAAIGLVTGGAMGAAAQVGAVRGKQSTVTETPAEKQARTTVQNSILKTAAAVNAEEQRNAIKEWGQRVASNSPLRKEAPDSFKEFVRTMAEEDGALKEVYADGKLLRESLAQAGINEDKLKATMPEVAESLDEALATNGEARIPIEDYAAHIVGTPVEQAILDHLRTTPTGMTYAEAQVYFQEQQDDFIKQAEALVSLNEPVLSRKEFEAQAPEGVKYKDYLAAHKNKVEVFAKDLETVHDKLLEGLDSTGRFPRSITRVYAIPFREFYATNAARMGVLPTELYDSLPLNFQQMSAGDVLDPSVLSQDEIEKRLVAQHNISVPNLIHADRMGGLAAPSLAITDKAHTFDSFGDITLISSKDMIDPRSGAKVFGADIYSPRYPRVDYAFSKDRVVRLNEQLKDQFALTNEKPIEAYDINGDASDAARTLENNAAVMAAFLESKKIKPKLAKVKKKTIPRWALKYADKTMYSYIDTPAFIEDVSKHTEHIDEILSRAENEEERSLMRRRLANSKAYEIDAYRVDRPNFGKIDPKASLSEMNRQIYDKGLHKEYTSYVYNLTLSMNPTERIFKGFTNSGSRKYIPHTIDNVIAELRKNLRGGENFNYGLGSIRARYTPQFKTLEQIRKAEGKLLSSEDFERVKTELDSEFNAVLEELTRYYKHKDSAGFGLYEIGSQALTDAASLGVPRALKENQFENVPQETQNRIADFLAKLADVPAEYFEVKLLRQVGLQEFSGAVVPKNAGQNVIDILKKNGVTDIKFYKPQDKADRLAKVNEFSNLFFQNAKLPETITIDGVEQPTRNSEGKLIHKDLLGFTVTNISVSGYADISNEMGTGQKWFASSMAVGSIPRDVKFGTYEEVRDFLRGYGFSPPESAGTPGYNAVHLNVVHPAGVAYEEQMASQRSKKWASAKKVFLRYGRLPKGGKSKNFADGIYESGVSVFNGELLKNGEVRFITNHNFQVGTLMVGGLQSRELYVVEGVEVGTGSDGEPVLRGAKTLTINQAVKKYFRNEFSDDPNILKQSAFYSALQREIPSISKIADKNGMVKTDQAIAWIEARQKEGKFKLEEVEAVGLKDWLQATEGKVSVTDIDTFVRENGVQIEEKLLGGVALPVAVQEYEDQPEIYSLYRADDPEGISYGSLGQIILTGKGEYEINVPEITGKIHYPTLQEALERVGRGSKQFSETKFESYVLPGGKNYRELLLMLPKTEGQDFRSAHYDEKNILAHVRFDDRTNPTTGQKILFIEEIQSDWAQQGRDKGFGERNVTRYEVLINGEHWLDFNTKAEAEEASKAAKPTDKIEIQEVVTGRLRGIPTGPFVQNTKSWTALAVKRLLRYAAENGFDKIAWTTGEQQAARYDLSKQIQRIDARKGDAGTYDLHVFDNNERTVLAGNYTKDELVDTIGKEMANKIIELADSDKTSVKTLPEGYDISLDPKSDKNKPFTVIPPGQVHGMPFAGRHATEAEAVQAAVERINRERDYPVRLEGLDLKIGGEGMKAFYDQIVPQVVNEVSKKLGGGKVGATEILARQDSQTEADFLSWAKTNEPGMPENVLRRLWKKGETDEVVKRFMGESGAIKQHSLGITPEMREKILSGLPLFQGQRAGFDPSTFTISLLKGADLSSVIHEGAHFYLEALADLAGRDNAPQQIKDDFRTTLNWFGITGDEEGTPGGDLLEQKAFHGSPHNHDKFDSSKIGTGEGAQMYGYGLYFADSKEVAEHYKKTLENIKPAKYSIDGVEEFVVHNDWKAMYLQSAVDGTLPQHIKNIEPASKKDPSLAIELDYAKSLLGKNVSVVEGSKTAGKLYEVELAPEQDEYLLWDKPLSEQSEKVRAALKDTPFETSGGDWYGSDLYDMASSYSSEDGRGKNPKGGSDLLHSLGIRGIKYLDGSSRAKGEGAYNYVVFSDEDITIVQKYDQGGETHPPGQLPPGKTPEEIWRSMTLDQKRRYHEQWAQSYERYTMEGKAPTVEMQSVFSRFREWMLSVYKSMKDFLAQNPLAGKLNDDIRAVFDRLIASEDKIYQAEEARGYSALFGSAEEAGLSEKEFEDYQTLGKLASARAVDEMNGRSIRDMRWLSNAKDKTIKRLQAEAKTKRAAVMAQVADEVDSMPLNRARNFLAKGEFIDENGVRRESETKFKLNSAEVKALSNGQIPDAVKGMVSDDGVGLELAAKLLGYQNPEALLNDLVNGESRDVTIQGLTDQRMLEQYGDLTDDSAIERAAEKAIHNEARAKFMATGLKILAKTELSATQLNRAAKLAAEATIAKKKIRALTPGQFTRAEAKANREAIESVAKDPRKAVEAQRAALLNNRLAKAALEASEEVDSILKYFKKFESQGVRKAVGIDQMDQIDDLLQTVDRDKNTPLKEIDKRQALADWVAEQEADGFEPVLDPILAEQIKAKHYKEMTVDELRMLRDTVKQIEHVGRLKQTLLTEMRRADFRERVEEAEASIRDNANRTVKERGTPTDVAGITGQWVRQMIASHRKFSSYMREMDGGKDGGVMWRLLSKNMNAAGDQEIEMRRASGEAIAELFKGFKQEKAPLNLYAKRTQIPGTEIFMTQEQRIMFGMNWGNEGNRQRLLDGGITGKRALSITEAQAILDTLTKEEWDFIQGTWDHIATYKDQIAALERKLTGIEPEWIEPSEIKTKYGTYRGGYLPAKYDIELSSRSESLEAAVDLRMGMKGAFNTAATRNGYTKARSEAVMNRPLLLSYNVIANHISEVTHRLAWQPWLIDANRILKALDAPIREHYGAEVLRELRNTVIDIAAGDIGARTPMERAINHLRTGSTIVGMGWRFSTAFLQPSGLAQSWARIGGRWMAKGIAESLKNPNKAGEFVNARSSLMNNRDITMNREVREVLDRIRTTESVNAVTGSYFSLIAKMQRMVDIPTWMGAYEKALHDLKYEVAMDAEQRGQIENDAVALADQAVVDSQSGGQIKDLASIQRGHPGLKLFTNFYSYFSATYNLNIEALRRTNFRSLTDVAFLASDLVLLNVLPVIFAVALKEMTKGKCGDDLECLAASYGYEQMGFMFGQMVLLRDAGSAALVAAGGDQYGYSGPAGLRFFSDLYKAGVQANQGELDWPLFKSVSNTAGVLLHFPTGQINTTLEGIIAVENGDVDGVSILPALLFGPPKE